MPAKTHRLSRLLREIDLIQNGRPARAHELARELGIAVRTFHRDIHLLEQAGFAVYADAEANGYRMRNCPFLPPMQFSFDEALAVLALGAHDGRHPAPTALHAGLQKLANALPRGIREEVQDLLPHIRYHARPREHPSPCEFYAPLAKALRLRRVVRLRYYSVRGDAEFKTELRVYAMFFHRHSWYAIGHSDRDAGTRIFKIARILDFTMTRARYSIPPQFDLDDALSGAWGIITDGPGYDVAIRFLGRGAKYVRETLWHPRQKITDLLNGECRLEVFVNGFDELVPWILSWGHLAVVEKPAALREAVHREAMAIVRVTMDSMKSRR